MDAPRHDLYRSAPSHVEVREADSGRLTLYGHFSVFDTPTVIRSAWEGEFVERVAPGAFAKTIAERGDQIKVMWNHGRSEILPEVPIARLTNVGEDTRGGYYEAELFNGLPEWLYEGLRANQYGASFKFATVRDVWNDNPERSDLNPDGLPERTVTEAKLFELGPVTWPAYAEATAGVRSLSDRFHDLSTSPADAAPAGTSASDAATSNTTHEADDSASHLEGPNPRDRRMRSLQLRGVIFP
jgi:HK97 family phage prohead protease